MNKHLCFLSALFTMLIILLAACSPESTTNALSGTSWHLVSYGPIDQQTPAAEGVTTLVQFSPDGQVSGSFGCNQFSGQFRVQGGKITFDQLLSTLMACQEPQASQESAGF
jgi:heat shock protein HslJ